MSHMNSFEKNDFEDDNERRSKMCFGKAWRQSIGEEKERKERLIESSNSCSLFTFALGL